MRTIEGDPWEALYWLSLPVGAREGEALGVKWTDINFKTGDVHFQHSLQRVPGQRKGEKSRLELRPTKTPKSQRKVPLPPIVLEKLLAHRNRQEQQRVAAGSSWIESGFVFTTSKGTAVEPRNMLRDYYRLRDRAGLPKIRFHDLRHSAATIMHEAGIPDTVIQRTLGHASVRTTQETYMHSSSRAQKEAAVVMDGIFRPVAVTVAVKTKTERPN